MQAVKHRSDAVEGERFGTMNNSETRQKVIGGIGRAGKAGLEAVLNIGEDIAQVKDKGRLLMKVVFMLALLLLVGIAFNAYTTSINYDITEMNKEINQIKNEVDTLNLKIASSLAPDVIEERAMTELGMEYPSASQYVYINSVSDSSESDYN